MILLDTCALIWWTLEPSMLSKQAQLVCNSIGKTGAIVSSISFWEIGIKMKKGTLPLPISLTEYAMRVSKIKNLQIVAVDENIWIRNIELEWDHRDPADRTIVASAEIWDLPIVTKDSIISEYYQNTIW